MGSVTLDRCSLRGVETERGNTFWKGVTASDLLHLQLGGFHTSVQVRIFNALGQKIYETQVDATPQVETLRIPVAAWPPGVFSVQIQSGGKVLTRQVAVQR
ncbi:MAG: T9SS type A sorting domain-containing protein [Saprospiraceae bacterium]|nr:T9SS type A sorting domain-containing protein [Saprospiraceae bacterium]MDZ4703441.1 T9SS type A sorting domain-containing protein [Saprospiraceae bacterium]